VYTFIHGKYFGEILFGVWGGGGAARYMGFSEG
jgi:hypothetical protein